MDQRYRFKAQYQASPTALGYKRPQDAAMTVVAPHHENLVKSEFQTDVVGNKFHFNPVSHTKVQSVPGTPEPLLIEGPFPTQWSTWHYFGEQLPLYFNTSPHLLPLEANLSEYVEILPPGEAATFTRQALEKVTDQMPTVISIANFVYELREVKDLIPRINGWSTISDGWLNLNFGWIPLIQDIKNLLTIVATVRKRLEHLKKVNGRTVTISHMRRYVLIEDTSAPSFSGVTPESSGATPWVSKTSYEEVTVRQHMMVAYDLDLKGADAFLNAMCAALGLMNPLSIIWNAIPFSFVVDWFIDLGSLLDSWGDNQPFTGTIAIKGASCSFKRKTLTDHWTPTKFPLVGPREGSIVATTLIHDFHRRHGTPEGTIDVTGLTPFQQSLAAALIASNANLGNPNRRRRKSR